MVYLSSTITTIILVVYSIFLYRITGRNRSSDKLIWSFAIIAIVGFVYHMYLFDEVTHEGFVQYNNLMSRIIFSIQYSLEMFLANTIIFKGDVLNALGDRGWLYQLFLPLYGMAILTSGFAIFHFLSRRLYNWFWLTFNRSTNKTHIFIGLNEASFCLANDIMIKHQEEQVVFVDFDDRKDNPQGLSIWDIVARFFATNQEIDILNKCVVLKAGKGIGKIVRWLENEKNNVYILSDNQNFNVSVLEHLWEYGSRFKCMIYCHAKKEGLINRYDNIADVENKVRFVDSSFLAVAALKKSDVVDLLPINYVEIAKDVETDRCLGYVTSSFNCAIIGFGETGKEALRFLYEFGAFPDKNNGKSPFKCHIFDSNLAQELGEFGIDLTNICSSVAKNTEIELHPCSVDTIEFHKEICGLVKELNYIVICLGNDSLNLKTALDIVECAEIEGKSTLNKFCIVVKQTNISKLNQDTLDKANMTYNGCIHPFGLTKEIWKTFVINDEELNADARRFYESYSMVSDELNKENGWGVSSTWDEREINGIRNDNYKIRCKARRQKMQDYSNSLHKSTKRALCEPYNNLADFIYSTPKNASHCQKEYEELLEHLAVCEHLRWEASHIMMGYKPTDGDTDDLKKLHNCIRPYNELDEITKHYDWLVVKNSL